MEIVQPCPRRSRARRWFARVISALLGIPLIVAGLAVAPANAATLDGMLSFGGYHVGAFISSNGARVYCLEPGVDTPFSDQQVPRKVDELRGYSMWTTDNWGWNGRVSTSPATGELLRAINWVLTERGQTLDADRAAEVQIAVWLLRKEPGNTAWLDAKLSYIRENGGGRHVDRGIELAEEAKRSARGPSGYDPSALLEVSAGDEHGTGTVSYPAGTTEVRLQGAKFADGTSTMKLTGAAAQQAGTAQWVAELHTNEWARMHAVVASGEWAFTETYWPATVILHPPTRDTEQLLGAGVAPVTERRTGTFEPAKYQVDGRFEPVISTSVPERFVERGGVFRDTVTVGAAPGAPWPSRSSTGEQLPLVADGVLYGPFVSPQFEQDKAPKGAPIAARSRIEVDSGAGTYLAETGSPARESGYYYWVWSIAEPNQAQNVRDSSLLEPGRHYTDRFGQLAESQVVATALEWDTRLTEHELTLDDRVLQDSVRVRVRDGGWLRGDDGARIPARLRMTVYNEPERPELSETAPEHALELGSFTVDVAEPGVWIDAAPFEIPFDTRGWVSVQTCLVGEDQDESVREYLLEWCDEYGIESETAQIVVPEVRTEAVPRVTVGEEMWDLAIITGPVPAAAKLEFTYYLAPVAGDPKYGPNWRPLKDADGSEARWTAEELDALEPAELCVLQPVAALDPIAVDEAGEVRSASVVARTAGTGYWVERLTVPHPETGEAVTVHEGECGIENERTIIEAPEPPVIALTGMSPRRMLYAGGIGMLIVGASVLGISRTRARELG